MSHSRQIQTWIAVTACLLVAVSVEAAGKVRHLGPTGIFAEVDKQQVLVTKVDKGSPAEGKLVAGDVILGAGGGLFKGDVRKAFADAIDRAETEQSKGLLTLTVEKPSKENSRRTVELQLRVLGSYDPADPLSSPKANAIITSAAEKLLKTGKYGALDIGLLGLLATGEQKYIDAVAKHLHQCDWARPTLDLSPALEKGEGGLVTWSWAYRTLTLCEYFLMTGDQYVLPAIQKYALTIAQGQDAAGLWGHRMAYYSLNNGARHGRLPGYAVMNQTSLPLFISLMLAEKCGVKDPEVRRAVEQTATYYRNYVGKGALPYGVHAPFVKEVNDNGKSGLSAVAMSILGDAVGAEFFARLSAASYTGLESGHTGHYFNQLWTGLGAHVAGPQVTAAYFNKTQWLQTLNRTWDGGFTYDDEGGNRFSYSGLSDEGAHLLNYCLPRRKLFITGKNPDESLWLGGELAREAVAAGETDFAPLNDPQLLGMLGDPLPWRRTRAAAMLGERAVNMIPALGKMLKEGTWQQKVGVCQVAEAMGEKSIELQGDLASIVTDEKEHSWVRQRAVAALCAQGESARKYFPDLLKVIVSVQSGDPFGELDRTLAMEMSRKLSPDPYALGLVADKKLFYDAINVLLAHKHEWARSAGMSLIKQIPLEDFHYVSDAFMRLMHDKDLTYIQYHNSSGSIGTGGTILARLRVGEGIDCLTDCLTAPTGKWGFKYRMFLKVFPLYGSHAQPALKKLAQDPSLKKMFEDGDNQKWQAMIKAIETAPPGPALITVDQAKQAGLKRSQP